MLIVNTASACGFTPQFAGLEALQKAYGKKGLVVLGFPCNQFGAQDRAATTRSPDFCQLNYGVSFPMMAKIDVNGGEAHPLYQWLSARRRDLGDQVHQMELHQVSGRQRAIPRHAPPRYPGKSDKRTSSRRWVPDWPRRPFFDFFFLLPLPAASRFKLFEQSVSGRVPFRKLQARAAGVAFSSVWLRRADPCRTCRQKPRPTAPRSRRRAAELRPSHATSASASSSRALAASRSAAAYARSS